MDVVEQPRAHVAGAPGLAGAVVRAMEAALGVTGVVPARAGARAPCVLLFEQAGPAVEELLREHAGGRTLAACIGGAPLPVQQLERLVQAGAADVVEAPDATAAASVLAPRLQRWCHIGAVLDSPLVQQHLVGHSRAWRQALAELVEAAMFSDAHVLLLGESGTGKELAARLVHTLDGRTGKRELVLLDCSTLNGELAASELFGHERGAYTGAHLARDGAFARADGGTLFLDEVGELPLALQPQLLRVVQEQAYKRVGGSHWARAAFRLVSATQRELASEVAGGHFRHDLYHRLAGHVVRLPALAERREDIVPLAEHFLALALPAGTPADLSPPLRELLCRREYPGNVRELRQLVQRIAARHVGPGPVTVGDLPADAWPPAHGDPGRARTLEDAVRQALAQGAGLREIGQLASDVAIRVALEDAAGNLQRAARRLQVTDRALQLRRAARSQPSSAG